MAKMDDSSVSKLINFWRSDPSVASNITHWVKQSPRAAFYADFPKNLDPRLLGRLFDMGISRLYRHQYDSINHVLDRTNTVISTGTASGKSLCFQIPILNSLYENDSSTALCIYPAKALAQDQLNAIRRLSISEWLSKLAIYDGDTPQSARKLIRENSNVLFTNPDMLHIGILPHHTNWARFIRNLKYVVLDEFHQYRGIFGSHIANVIRRLRRICSFYGSNPVFIGTSATIANPRDLFSALIGDSVICVDEDSSPIGERNFALYNPPIVNEKLGIRRGALSDAVRLSGDLLGYNVQTLVFSQTRRSVEIFLKYLRENHPWDTDSIYSYRSGYLPKHRRQIEEDIKHGKARIIASTNALELGVDIGSLDCAMTVGYPGTIASTRQELGRAGRKLGTSLGMMVASANPLDQYIIRHPEYLFGSNPESARINPDNPLILIEHLKNALFELPFEKDESFGNLSSKIVSSYLEVLLTLGSSKNVGGKYYWMSEKYPADGVSLRTASANRIQIVEQTEKNEMLVGYVDLESAYWMVHPGAVYLHAGDVYTVKELNLDAEKAILVKDYPEYFTEAASHLEVKVVNLEKNEPSSNHSNYYGEILVNSQVIGYKKLKWYTNEVMGSENLSMPITSLQTTGFWVGIHQELISKLEKSELWSGFPNDYGFNWESIRSAVVNRDNHSCQVCGLTEKQSVLHVHHMVPFRRFTDTGLANQMNNLITLCSQCHKQAEMQLKIRSGLAGLTYLLHNLAPLFVMCDINDIGAFSEPASELADGNPIVLLYDAVPGGIGLSEELYKQRESIFDAGLEVIESCPCEDGCPSCIGVAGELGTGGKLETMELLRHLIQVKNE